MLLKRIYDWDAPKSDWKERRGPCEKCEGKGVVVNDTADGVATCDCCEGRKVHIEHVPPLKHVELRHTGVKAEQNFSSRLISVAKREGWCKVTGDELLLDVKPEPLRYSIKRTPGRYCCHCGEELPGQAEDMIGTIARQHVSENHYGIPSPEDRWPAGYCQINAYECVLNEVQHLAYQRLA